MGRLRITERTFGLELEYADVDKKSVYFPSDYSWDEEEGLFNTDGTKGTPSSRFGGEINTPPMLLRHKDIDEFRKVIESFTAAGAVGRYGIGIDVHIYAGDLDVEDLKKVYILSYYTSSFIKELCNIEPYSDQQRFRPSPTMNDYLKVKKVETLDEFRTAFVNNTKKGYQRNMVNVAHYFVHETIEFRTFNSTTDFRRIMNSVLFAYRFVDYALKHEEEDFAAIKTKEDFIKRLKVPTELPILPPPMLYFSSVKDMDVEHNLHAGVSENAQFVKELIENTGECIMCCNPRMYELEVRLFKYKKIKIFNNDELNHIVYCIVKDDYKLTYIDDAAFINEYNGISEEQQIACLLFFGKVYKYFGSTLEYKVKLLNAIKSRTSETMQSALLAAKKIVELISSCEYTLGTINDAFLERGDVYYNYDDYTKHRSVVSSLKKYSDYDMTFDKKVTYYGMLHNIPKGVRLHFLSAFAHHDYEVMAKIGNMRYYISGQVEDGKLVHKRQTADDTSIYPHPPEDLVIDDASKLSIEPVPSKVLHSYQLQYIKKVYQPQACLFGYLVRYDKYVLGGFGFDFPKSEEWDVYLKTDFATDNAIPRLSKLILLCIKSVPVQMHMSRTLKRFVTSIYTKVYTNKPVSMKYRGLFKKVAQEDNHLLYQATLGDEKLTTIEDVLNEYNNIIARSNKNE